MPYNSKNQTKTPFIIIAILIQVFSVSGFTPSFKTNSPLTKFYYKRTTSIPTITLNSHRSNVDSGKGNSGKGNSGKGNTGKQDDLGPFIQRREIIHKAFISAICTFPALLSNAQSTSAVERAVGSAEKGCREDGNCLEKGDWDGAVGWNWGGKDRCDATDPRCGADGQLREEVPQGAPVPDELGLKISHKVKMDVSIGKSERGTLVIGLYGENAPFSVQQMLDFLDPQKGLLTTSKFYLEEGYGVSSAPLSLLYSGALNILYPNQKLEFGILSQQIAYGKKKGLSRIPENFVPQPRPTKNLNEIKNESSVRLHDVAGLLSIPSQGLGYGGTGFESDDEAYGSAFQITSTAIPEMDKKEKRKVIGQIMDKESMALLERLASLPTKKGLKGIVPGQNYGPPLLKVQVMGVSVESAQESNS